MLHTNQLMTIEHYLSRFKAICISSASSDDSDVDTVQSVMFSNLTRPSLIGRIAHDLISLTSDDVPVDDPPENSTDKKLRKREVLHGNCSSSFLLY